MPSTGVLVGMCIVLVCLVCLVHGATGNGLLHIPSSAFLAQCPSRCGDIKITYPFGIGPRCFRQGFELTCDNTTSAPRLFLGNTSITQITDLFSTGSTAFTSIIGYNITMSPSKDTYNRSWEAPAGAVVINYYNRLYVVGCYIDVYMFGDNMTGLIGACMSTCTDETGTMDMERANFGGSCSGIGCCYIDLPRGRDLPTFMINLVRHNSTRAEQDRALSKVKIFLSDYYRFASSDLFSSWVNTSNADDARFDIAVTDQPNCERAQMNKDSYACNDESSCSDLPYARESRLLLLLPQFARQPLRCRWLHPSGLYNSTHKENCTRSCGNMTIPFPFGIEEGCYARDNFRLNCTPQHITVLDRGYAQYRVTNVSLDDGVLAVSNMLNDTSSKNVERIVHTNYDGTYASFENFGESVVDGIYYFSQEDEIINWVVANLTCQQAMHRYATYACVSPNSHCQNAMRGKTRYGYLCKCNDGFQGNPYLQNNCTDIDECSIPNKCNGICHNYVGDFNCTSCSHGKKYDPKTQKCVMSAKEHNLILGIAIGVACGLGSIIVALGAIVLTRRWKTCIQRRIRKAYFKKNQGLLLEQLISNESTTNKTKIFSLEDLEEATNNFDTTRVLGCGGHGMVYKGILLDQRVVAIKKSKMVEQIEIEQFINEVAILSQIIHRNVVKLFGCCLEDGYLC